MNRYSLPSLNKKIIYIDQFAISEMMKFLNPETKSNKKGLVDKYWGRLFCKLDRLCKLQLIVCPKSSYHEFESSVSPFPESLKRMYEQLSCNVSFKNEFEIKKRQIRQHSQHWIDKKEEINFSVDDAIDGEVNKWTDKFIISITYPIRQQELEEMRLSRERIHKDIVDNYKKWQLEKDKTFNDWFNEECSAIGPYYLDEYYKYYKQLQSVLNGYSEPTEDTFSPTQGAQVVTAVKYAFEKAGVDSEDIGRAIWEYFHSSEWSKIAFVRLSAMLLAALARRASMGQKRLPNQGTLIDFDFIPVLLPYCDAMFIDKDCDAFLNEEPLNKELKRYGTKIFSLRSKEKFIEYLNEIEDNVHLEHITMVEKVYGKGFVKPYTKMYDK